MAPYVNGGIDLKLMRTAGVSRDDDFGVTDGSKSSSRTLDVAVDLRDRRIDHRMIKVGFVWQSIKYSSENISFAEALDAVLQFPKRFGQGQSAGPDNAA